MGRPRKFDPEVAVERAMGVFWRKGYAGTSPQDLVDALGIGRGSLYNAFQGKNQLFQRVLVRYHDQEAVRLIELLDRPGPVRERLRSALETIIEADFADPDRRGCLAVNTAIELAGRDEEATRLVRRMFDRLESTLRALVEEGQRSGEIDRGRDPAAVAGFLLSAINGMRVLTKTAESPDQLRRIVDATLDLL
ncbi:transcriptional regulator, TetR family [Streptoalloteichus tenebrarius]|uniref:Transcriptional regulator, TetR family n=1 Tax=Streptoalloteichus tenebrarius (strain ATCC 17920 / DSM 40477 / JCM 4838 / CBS 697.72 / NBRC 16177 / NCIMB 11028 / NRRL B-12390 / A12253. 1 / ISP 5477) TaxID=1933 RepID=A0ABT1HMS0_STRSD|nr:TetR/AcrR family transcriptional regulator [Streptoalloteichus tenebrarius]MCP2256798.1 transcriptional regulator, TetR family [Streptoalloteichus tenebrarius]BFF00296.1 TetR/AcrR family transcriptional regulator [Streptoalloteichus tenebrarius]